MFSKDTKYGRCLSKLQPSIVASDLDLFTFSILGWVVSVIARALYLVVNSHFYQLESPSTVICSLIYSSSNPNSLSACTDRISAVDR